MRNINLNRQKLGLEDLLFGIGIVTQIRAGQNVEVTKINAGNLPFDETQSLLEWAQSVNIAEIGSMTTELQAIYDNLTTIGNVEDNLPVINTLEDNLVALQSLYTNISKLQNIDTNMSKLQNIDTNMTKLQNIDTNITKLQAIYNDLTKLESIYDNLTMLLSIYTNLTALNNINSQVIPNLTELLLVNDNAIQVAADKLTVAADKGIVAGYKDDVSAMKVAVESIYDTFDDRFLGAKTNDPIVDNDGNALQDGAMYFNGSSNALKVYSLDNTTWYTIPQIYLSSLLDVILTSITTGDILTWNGTKWVNTRTPSFDSIKLNGGIGTEGTLSWNANECTANLTLPGGSMLQIGQEEVRTVRNSTASPIPDGTLVMFDGTIGNSGRVKVKPFTGGFSEAHLLYGMTTQLIASNSDGIINISGKVRGINTTGSLYGETWADGDILYAKPDNAGALTKVVPADDKLKLRVAAVVHSHTSGTLEIRFIPFNENIYYTKTQSDALKVPINLSAAIDKTIPVDADLIALSDSDSSFSLKKLSWLNLKGTIKTYFDTLFVKKISSTDNAVVRFKGTTGEVQNSGIIIDDKGDVGVGVTPSAWYSGKHIQTLYSAFGESAAGYAEIQSNSYEYSSNAHKYLYSGLGASRYTANFGNHNWYVAQPGTAGQPITWTNAMSLDASGNLLLTSGTGALGYGTGAGGTVTQLTSKSTAITLNKPTGTITMNNSAIPAGSTSVFNFNCAILTVFDTIKFQIVSGYSTYESYTIDSSMTNGNTVRVVVKNNTSESLSEQLVLNYIVIKGSNY